MIALERNMAIIVQCFSYLSKNKGKEQTNLPKVGQEKHFLPQTEIPVSLTTHYKEEV